MKTQNRKSVSNNNNNNTKEGAIVMKSSVTIALIVGLALVGQASAAVIGPNLIANPGAEASATAINPPWVAGSGRFEVLAIGAPYAHTGNNSFQSFDPPDPEGNGAELTFERTGALAVDTSKQYQFEMWYWTLSPRNNGQYGTSSVQLAYDTIQNGPWEDIPQSTNSYTHYGRTIGPAGSGSDYTWNPGQTEVYVTIYDGGLTAAGEGRMLIDDLVFAQTDWVPVPEPGTVSLLAVGGLLIMRRVRRMRA